MFLKPFKKHQSSSLCLLEHLYAIYPGQYEVISVSQREVRDNSLLPHTFQNWLA